MSSPSANKRRMDTDVIKLIESKFEVTLLSGLNEFYVKFYGPPDSPFETGVWRVLVKLPDKYPFSSPSISFVNKIFHPNVDFPSGTVCLNVINNTWTSLYDLVNIFETFLPQLLIYPNSDDPLNGEAASQHRYRPKMYIESVLEHIQKYATEEAIRELDGKRDECETGTSDSDSLSDLSDHDDLAADMDL